VRSGKDAAVAPGHPAELPASMLARAFGDDMYGDAAKSLSPAAEISWPSNRRGFGRGYWIGLHDAVARLAASGVLRPRSRRLRAPSRAETLL
jgi:hypothetical protein